MSRYFGRFICEGPDSHVTHVEQFVPEATTVCRDLTLVTKKVLEKKGIGEKAIHVVFQRKAS